MIVDRTAEMEAAVEAVYKRLPEHYRTEIIRAEIAEAVSRSTRHDREGFDKAARAAVYAMFTSLDRAVEIRGGTSTVRK